MGASSSFNEDLSYLDEALREVYVPSVLVAIGDAALLDIVVDFTAESFEAHVTCAREGSDAVALDRLQAHQVAIVSTDVDGDRGAETVRALMASGRRPVIALGRDPTVEDVVGMMRLGVCDFLPTPIDLERLIEGVERGLLSVDSRRRRGYQSSRLRSLVRRMLRERRDMRARMDLLCRDMVGAHRRLFHRVLGMGDGGRDQL